MHRKGHKVQSSVERHKDEQKQTFVAFLSYIDNQMHYKRKPLKRSIRITHLAGMQIEILKFIING